MKKLFGGLVFTSLLLGGCAMSPQQVAVAPDIAVEVSEPVTAAGIGLRVYDERPSAVLGSLGGVYSETSMISTGPDFTDNIRFAAKQALQKSGLNIDAGEDAPQFQLYIDRLTYEVLDSYLQDIKITAAAHVVITHGGQQFTGRYSSDLNQRLVKAPSSKKNDEMVNQVLNDVLARAFNDESLRGFLGSLSPSQRD